MARGRLRFSEKLEMRVRRMDFQDLGGRSKFGFRVQGLGLRVRAYIGSRV